MKKTLPLTLAAAMTLIISSFAYAQTTPNPAAENDPSAASELKPTSRYANITETDTTRTSTSVITKDSQWAKKGDIFKCTVNKQTGELKTYINDAEIDLESCLPDETKAKCAALQAEFDNDPSSFYANAKLQTKKDARDFALINSD